MEEKSRTGVERQRSLDWGRYSRSVGPRVRLLRNLLTSRGVAALADFGLPTGSLSVMVLIEANEGCSQTELARTTGLTKSGLVGIVDELEKRGFAARDRSPNDRRRNKLYLTDAGRAQLDLMVPAAVAQEAPIRAALSEAELDQLVELLERTFSALTDPPDA